MEKNYPRVLVSTLPAWSQRSGANTFATLFEGYPSEKLANIYTRADLPDSKVASRYFRIVEGNVLKSIIKPSISTGSEVSNQINKDSNELKSELKRYKFFTRHRWTVFLWLRELGWKLGKWKSVELDNFIDSFEPEVFVFHIESYWYFNRLNEYLINRIKPKRIIGYLWDDNFTYKQSPYNLIARFNRFFTRRQVKRLVSKCDKILSISPKMKLECDEAFNIDSILINKPILTESALAKPVGSPIRIVYSGSLVIGRNKTIALLADCLKEINHNGTKIYLDIYSGTALTKRQRNSLTIPGSCYLKGHLPQDKVFKEQEKADILLFAENLNNKHNNLARLSFSTKITDYLSRNRAIMAIGPNDIAPIQYLKEEDAAIVCTSREEIIISLQEIIKNKKLVDTYAAKAHECGLRNHSRNSIINLFQNIITTDRNEA